MWAQASEMASHFKSFFQPGFKGTWCIVMYAWVATPINSRPWWSAFSLSRLALPRDATIRCEMNCEGTTVTCDMQTFVPWSNYVFLFQKGDGHQSITQMDLYPHLKDNQYEIDDHNPHTMFWPWHIWLDHVGPRFSWTVDTVKARAIPVLSTNTTPFIECIIP